MNRLLFGKHQIRPRFHHRYSTHLATLTHMSDYHRHFLPCFFTLTVLLCTLNLKAQPVLRDYQGSIESLQFEADQSDRPYLLYFFADWSEPCQQMERATYRSEAVVEYINRHFFFYRINTSTNDRGEVDLPSKYHIFLYPTLLVCSPQGEVVQTFSGYIAPAELLEHLRALDFSPQAPPRVASQPAAPEAPLDPFPQAPSVHPATIVVQVGVYGDYDNVQPEIQRLQQRYQVSVRVIDGNLNGSPIHRIVVGPFASQHEAERFQQRFKSAENRHALIKDLKDL